MNIENLNNKLESLQKTWDAAPSGDLSFDEGEYEGEITDFDFFESKDGGELFLKTEVTARVPRDVDGRTGEIINSLSHPERVRYSKELLAKLGVDVDSLSMGELIPVLRSVVGTGVTFAVKHNERNGKTYENIYINDVLFPPMKTAAEQSDVPPDTEGLPVPGGDAKKEFGF